jgi:cell division initiation protein
MKYTPLDIQRREFEKAFRGISETEVRAFLHEVAGEWEELLQENQKFRGEVLDLRERLQQYLEQDRIFKETLLSAQRSREEVIETAQREKVLIIKEAEFKAEELLREAGQNVAELETHVRTLKLERLRFMQEMDSLLSRTRRFLEEENQEIYPPSAPTRRLDEVDLAALDDAFIQTPDENGFQAYQIPQS